MKSVSYMQQGKHSTSQGTEPSDGILLRQSLAGDEYAFEALVNRYRSPLLNYIRRILKDDEQAYDVLQFVLLRLYVSQPTLLKDVPLRAWLFQVAHPLPEEIVEQRDLRAVLHQAIGKLPPRFRSIVQLRFFGELSFSEIG